MRAVAVAATILALAATPARAQQPPICMPIDVLAETLKREYRETPTHNGVSERAEIVLFASDNGETWTLVAVGRDGTACVGAMGTRWRATGKGA